MQHKWRVTPENMHDAWNYIRRKFEDRDFWDHRPSEDLFEAKEAFKAIPMTSEGLQSFLEGHIDPIQLKRLRTALRVKQSRKKTGKRSIEVPFDLYHRLKNVADAESVTLSQLIERLLKDRESRNPSLFS